MMSQLSSNFVIIAFHIKVVQYGFTKNAGFSVFSYDIQLIDTSGHPSIG